MNNIRFGSVCSGIEAASVAWKPLGWEAAWFSEIEPFPCAVLKHHYPAVPNHGDMTTLPDRILNGEVEAPDVFCGGTPCQAFSVAGMRKSLQDARGNLSLTFCEIANVIDTVRSVRGEPPCIIFWENVPGVLNTPDNAFGCFLAGLAGEDDPLVPAGKKWTNAGCVFGSKRTVAWRVTDAQYFGVAQRRRRVFVVASARDGFDPTQVLFEFDGVRRDIAPSREAGQNAAGGSASGSRIGCDFQNAALTGDIAGTLDAEGQSRMNRGHGIVQPYAVANCLTQRMHKGINSTLDEGQTPVLAAPIHYRKSRRAQSDQDHATWVEDHATNTLNCFDVGDVRAVDVVAQHMAVRRLTPIECERLQGFPDNYTYIPWKRKQETPDGIRYKALGNSWAVPNVRWIGNRINQHIKQL